MTEQQIETKLDATFRVGLEWQPRSRAHGETSSMWPAWKLVALKADGRFDRVIDDDVSQERALEIGAMLGVEEGMRAVIEAWAGNVRLWAERRAEIAREATMSAQVQAVEARREVRVAAAAVKRLRGEQGR